MIHLIKLSLVSALACVMGCTAASTSERGAQAAAPASSPNQSATSPTKSSNIESPETIADAQPRDDDDAWNPGRATLAKQNLPADIPMPGKTPYDQGAPEDKEQYLTGYRLGFTDGVSGTMVIRCYIFQPPASFDAGLKAGTSAGAAIHRLRQEAERHRDLGYSRGLGSFKVDETSSEADRKVAKSFTAFASQFAAECSKLFPQTLTVEVKDQPETYSYIDSDYSKSNTGIAIERRRFKGTITLLMTPKNPKAATGDTQELRGSYGLHFNDGANAAWKLDDGPSMWRITHLQRENAPPEDGNGTYKSMDSKLARELLNRATKAANER